MASRKKYINEHGEEIWGYLLNSKLLAVSYFDIRLQNETRSTLGLLISYAYADGFIRHFSIKKTALKRNVARWAIQNQINKLIKFEYLEKESSGGYGNTNHYRLKYENFKLFEGVIQLDDTPDVTQLGYTHVTLSDDTSVTPSGYIKKTSENKDNKKEKDEHLLDSFLYDVEEGIGEGIFSNFKNLPNQVIADQAEFCWEHWKAHNMFPQGCKISAFKGWLRNGLDKKRIKPTQRITLTNSNAMQGVIERKLPNPEEQFHVRLRSTIPEAPFNSWIRPLWTDGNKNLYAPTQQHANWVRAHYMEQLEKELGAIFIQVKEYSQKEPILEEI